MYLGLRRETLQGCRMLDSPSPSTHSQDYLYLDKLDIGACDYHVGHGHRHTDKMFQTSFIILTSIGTPPPSSLMSFLGVQENRSRIFIDV